MILNTVFEAQLKIQSNFLKTQVKTKFMKFLFCACICVAVLPVSTAIISCNQLIKALDQSY